MRRPGTLLLSRGAAPGLGDLAPRSPLIQGQRVRRFRLRRQLRRRARSLALALASAAVAAGGLAGLGAAGHWALTSPRFGVAHVDVVGARWLSAEQVAEASGIEAGESIWQLDTRAAAERVRALAWVKEAEVARRLPNRVVVTLREREPYALVQVGRVHWVDAAGVDLGPAPRGVPAGHAVLSGVAPEALGAPSREPAAEVAAGLAMLRALEAGPGELRPRVSEIFLGGESPVLVLVDGVEVRLGPTDWEARLARLVGVLAQLEAARETVTAIDLRFRDQVVLKTGRDDAARSSAAGRAPRL